ncbi:uncharacterized protein Fot_56583 [Forsythia ovata]|uniref:Survival motor neuron interacting protein 1 n=1 Tax=Forsythia ovata TaxID=205694 RepID=A0ABD1P1A7_9LAMI
MAETLDSGDSTLPALETTVSEPYDSLSFPKLNSNEGETEEALVGDTNNNQNNSLSLLKKPDFGFSGSEKQGPEVETETLHCYDVVQDSPSGDVAYDATLVSPEMVVHEIQEPPCSCVVKFVDDEIDSRTVKKQEEFSGDAIDSRTVTKQEGKFADDAITSKKLEEKFSDDTIDSRSMTKQEGKFSDDAITVKKEAEKFADDAIDSMTVKKQEDTFADDATYSRTLKKQEKFESLEKCTLKIQVIDETALIESPCLGNGTFNNGKFHETQGIKLKRPRRRGSKAAKNLETSGTRSQDCGHTGKKGKQRLVYSRKEMEALRYVGLEAQKNTWIGIYCGLGPVVAKEYDELTHHQKHNATSFDFDPRPQFLKASVPRRFFDEDCPELADNHFKNVNTMDTASCFPGNDKHDCSVVEGECSEDDDTDEDYSSIQKPAFSVSGEPDFDSGPPQDGLEYLRRVRWEAEQIPKVTVAKVEKSKLNKGQTLYMPQIPDIMKCPDNLLPLKQWEDTFLADFSKLRLGLAQLELEGSSAKVSAKSLSVHEEEMLDQISESIISENFDNLTVKDDSIVSETNYAKVNSHSPKTSSLSINSPTISTILKMESVARVSMLKRRIRSVESLSTLSRDDCLWLFALCAAVDCPLDADTCAALRSLLRKCASLRAAKSELDDDVIMLNILTTISGKYFGQLEN